MRKTVKDIILNPFNYHSGCRYMFVSVWRENARRYTWAKIKGFFCGKKPHEWRYTRESCDTGFEIADVMRCSVCGEYYLSSTFADQPSFEWCEGVKI
jgi:hypothetical protein